MTNTNIFNDDDIYAVLTKDNQLFFRDGDAYSKSEAYILGILKPSTTEEEWLAEVKHCGSDNEEQALWASMILAMKNVDIEVALKTFLKIAEEADVGEAPLEPLAAALGISSLVVSMGVGRYLIDRRKQEEDDGEMNRTLDDLLRSSSCKVVN